MRAMLCWPGTRNVRLLAVPALVAALVVLTSTALAADHTFHPVWNARMAVTDQSTSSGLQPWVWTAVTGSDGTGSLLAGKKADSSEQSAWTFTFASNLTSGLGAVSWSDAANARQRIFYASNGTVQMADMDNNLQNALVDLPLVSGASVGWSDVAAVTWTSGSTRLLSVAAYATRNGVTGHLCFWEKTATATTWSTSCTASPVMAAFDGAIPDVVGAVHGSTPVYFFRNANGRLGRARRTGTAAFTVEELATSPIAGSVFAINSQTSGAVDVGVIRTDTNRVQVGRLSSATATSASWTTLPALPGSAVPWLSNNSLNGVMYPTSAFSTRSEVAVLSTQGRLHTIHTTNSSGTTWATSWAAGAVPGNTLPSTPEQYVYGLGVAIGNSAGSGPRQFVVAGSEAGSDWAMSLHEYDFGFPRPFVDHVRFSFNAGGLYPDATGATESAAGQGAVYGIATALQRNNPPPWRNLIAGSTDGAESFDPPLAIVSTYNAGHSATDPLARHGGYGGHLLHYVDLQVQLTSTPPTCASQGGTKSISYRRGFVASDIANKVSWAPIVANGDFDHPGLGVTVDSAGGATAHVLFWDTSGSIKYWTLNASDVAAGPFVMPAFDAQPAGMLVGNRERTAYGYTFSPSGGFPRFCKMNGSQTSLVCGTPNVTPTPESMSISYGSPVPGGTFLGMCAAPYKCFDTAEAFGAYADPVDDRIHVAYQAFAPGSNVLSIYYTQSLNSSLTQWSAPIRIASHPSLQLIDPAITVDYNGTVVVSYSRIAQAKAGAPTDGQADVLVVYSRNGGTSFLPAEQLVQSWDADDLPFHCSRQLWFLGEYRHGDVVGSRALHLLPASSGGPLEQRAMWFSSAYNLP